MSERTIDGGNFVAGTQQGDPEKLKYLHTPGWQGKTFVGGSELRIDARACPGCAFPGAPEGKWPHTNDARCRLLCDCGHTREHHILCLCLSFGRVIGDGSCTCGCSAFRVLRLVAQ